MKAYFDASVLVSFLFEDDHSTAVRSWMSGVVLEPICSDFCWGEVTSTVASRVREKVVRPKAGSYLLAEAAVRIASWTRMEIITADVKDGTELVARFELGLRLPDAIHLAIARRHGAVLITTDKRQGDAAAALGIGYVDPTRLA